MKDMKTKGDNFRVLKQRLEAENQALLKQRALIQHKRVFSNHFSNSLPKFTPDPSAIYEEEEQITSQVSPSRHFRRDSNPRQIKSKIRDIIRICNVESQNSHATEYKEIVEAEEQILTYLDNLVGNSETLFRQETSPAKNVDLKEQLELKGLKEPMGNNAMEMIEEIQRKALIQIQGLRSDKISLLKKYNAEIKLCNNEKKKNDALSNQIFYLQQQFTKLGVSLDYEDQEKSPGFNHYPRIEDKSSRYEEKPQTYGHQRKKQGHVGSSFRPQSSLPLQSGSVQLQNEINGVKSENPQNYKNQLKLELEHLKGKVNNYENILQGENKQNQLDRLLCEGNMISQTGHNLIKSKSKPGHFSSNQEFSRPSSSYTQEMNHYKTKINRLLIENEGLKKKTNLTKFSNFSSPTYTPSGATMSKFSPSVYEGLINEMKRVTNINEQ